MSSRLDELDRRIAAAQSSLEQLNLEELREQVELSAKVLSANEAELSRLEAAHESVEARLAAARETREKAAEDKRDIDTQLARLVAESDALSYLLAETINPSGIPVADQIKVSAGMEVALAACLGTDLSLPYDSGDTGYWRQDMTVPSVQPPADGTPFSTFIAQSDVLKQALSGVSLIEDIQDVKHAQKQLKPGQALVSKEGMLWRWDGLVRKGPASNEAERIRQRQRLDALEADAAEIKAFTEQKGQKLATAHAELANIQAEVETSQQELQTARQLRDKAKQDADEAKLALKSATMRSVDVLQALELATSDRHSILSDEGLKADLENLQMQVGFQ